MNVTPTDYRRAAALVVHYGRKDPAGIDAVLDEVTADNRSDALHHLLLAVLQLYSAMMPSLNTNLGMKLLSEFVLTLATGEDDAA